MIHAASHMSLNLFSRTRGHSAVGAAAYRARTSYFDHHRSRRYTYRSIGGLLSEELIGWQGSAEELWNAAEVAETRSNARVARELRPALPAELPLDAQVRLVRGMALWLRDRYGVALQAVIHAPTFHDKARGTEYWNNSCGDVSSDKAFGTLWDPKFTNLNFHAHIQFSTRRVDPISGVFGEKTRELDDREQGPVELKIIRAEWEKRTNSSLKKMGSAVRVDLRSYVGMAADGDAPEGLVRQDHVGPRRTARSRKKIRASNCDDTVAGLKRKAVREHNESLWTTWLLLRQLERKKASHEDAPLIASHQEAQRKKTAAEDRQCLSAAKTAEDVEKALAAAHQFDSLLTGDPLTQAIAAAQAKDPEVWNQKMASSETLDLETFEPEAKPLPKTFLKIRHETVRIKSR